MLPAGEPRESAVLRVIEQYGEDPITLDAALSSLRGSEPAVLERIAAAEGERTPQKDAAIAMLAATIVRAGQDAAIQHLFARAADEGHAGWQRSAILQGVEIAILGAPMPGASGRRGRAAQTASATMPCPTCPGGRAGPGGAYAFPRPESAGRGRGGRGAGPDLRLRGEPAPLARLAADAGELSARAAALLARITWPGKPGEAAPVPPLTSDEQRRFDAGLQVYRNICQACHQPDGRGQDRLAPPLVGSPLALGPADVAARILLNGKEGAIGLMPPAGATLTDEQLAGVLTYIRREWGQDGTPVEPATIAAARIATAGRTRPWTDEELKALIGDGR
jgi:mono/diheme cytochrome c family protein